MAIRMQFDHFLAWAFARYSHITTSRQSRHVNHVNQGKTLSFSYLESYSPLDFWKPHQILWLCCIPHGMYKEDNLTVGM